jgi:hypothetical protein
VEMKIIPSLMEAISTNAAHANKFCMTITANTAELN